MLKIKKGIKKKIKGKKDKNDEIFTPEELAKYKKEKEEEARRLAGQQEQQPQETNEEKENVPLEDVTDLPEPEEAAGPSSENRDSSEGEKKEDWRNFFAATDTVLKKTTDNLVQIKEASYFQKKEEKLVEQSVKETESKETASSASASAAAGGKRWVDLERGGIDDELEEEPEEVAKEPEEPESEQEPELVPLQFIEDLPDVDVDDFTEVFDTTYVDNVESGEVKLHYIPDSPTTEDPNEPDPFDTSVVDKVLHTEEPEPKKKSEQTQQPEKKKKKLVSLGCAVDVLTGKVQTAERPSGAPQSDSKRRRIVKKEINLLGGDGEHGDGVTTEEGDKENEEQEVGKEPEEKNILDDILCVGDALDIPESGTLLCPTSRSTSPALSEENKDCENAEVILENYILCGNKDVDLSEFLESNGENYDNKESKQDSGKELDLKDLVAEFDIIDKSEVTNETLIPSEPDPIEDEFDAEFAFLAAESVAKAKEKEFEDLDDDPFDTSAAAHILGPEETAEAEKDPFDVGFAEGVLENDSASVKPTKPHPPRPATPKVQTETEEVDPFDTSLADQVLPVDHLATPDTALGLPDTLQPHSGADIVKSESFDPFDTSIAESFGKTELKVLETELLTANQNLKEEEPDDFDFDPRAGEPVKPAPERPPQPCLLTADEQEVTSDPVLTPAQGTLDDFDPFDTSIAAKVAIQSLEEELLSDTAQPGTESKSQPPPRPRPAAAHVFETTPTDTNPTLQPLNPGNKSVTEINEDFDPFDTSIADTFGKTELKALEDELLTSESASESANTGEKAKPNAKTLTLPVTPLRPPSPKCLLAAISLDDHPTLQPTLEPTDSVPGEQVENFDPFDTSIADQFGKTELKVLESELLVACKTQIIQEFDDFDPRAAGEVPQKPSKPSRPPSPAPPQCLLTATPAGTPPETAVLLAPTEPKAANSSEEFDPFDTSIAEKFGKTELKQLESELLQAVGPIADPFDDFDPRGVESNPVLPQKLNQPGRPPVPPAPCLLATTPTDQSVPLQPSLSLVQEPKAGITPDDFDPFDTTIAEKLCKTEIQAFEEALLTESNKVIPIFSAELVKSETANLSADSFLSSSPTENLEPALQPVLTVQNEPAELDPFDTSIAERFGKTELKTLESELLSNSGVKSNLSDDEFDPREEEAKTLKRPPPPVHKPPTPVNLLDASEEHNITDQPIQASQAQSSTEALDNYDPFDTTIADDIGPSKAELKYLESELLSAAEDPFDTSNCA